MSITIHPISHAQQIISIPDTHSFQFTTLRDIRCILENHERDDPFIDRFPIFTNTPSHIADYIIGHLTLSNLRSFCESDTEILILRMLSQAHDNACVLLSKAIFKGIDHNGIDEKLTRLLKAAVIFGGDVRMPDNQWGLVRPYGTSTPSLVLARGSSQSLSP